jgi:hypothetical protein
MNKHRSLAVLTAGIAVVSLNVLATGTASASTIAAQPSSVSQAVGVANPLPDCKHHPSFPGCKKKK